MSDYVPSESESKQDTRHTTRSPDPPRNRPSPRQTQSQPSQTGPIRGSTRQAGHQPALGMPPSKFTGPMFLVAPRPHSRVCWYWY
ncbi:hypothetical protein PGT21_015241 [Puccinia graminis f. sp. tritici]|uniref:Uncharacterized protein n=1 Tax=Puccinia graminis f. sp. tritici TaxID=56615 RepID=A0A5B0PL22_PUCGR|nr:hypothetical protein PGT21_015241 [Puccinia graminis f. sp. tritici]KAA1136718.1 hypothetical protein PGTUg99_037333 [Puccinia graminis f. sp. tritici]